MGAEARYGSILLSLGFALPELDACSTGCTPDLRLQSTDVRHPSPSAWDHQWLNDSELVLSVARIDRRYLLKFDDGHTFVFDPGARTVTCQEPVDALVRHQLLDQVLPRVLDHLGNLMIHASAVRTPHGVVMFVADTGAGKSTLVASFEAAGMELLSDDCMQVSVDSGSAVRCLPTYRSLRLWSDSADALMAGELYEPMSAGSDKRRLGLTRTAPADPSVIIAICVLVPDDHDRHEIVLSPVAPARAVSLLLAQCFRLDPTDESSTKRTFERCADVVERVPIVELAYPRDYARLPEVRNAVLERAATGDWMSASPA